MQIRLIPPSPHPAVLYALTFPNVLSLQALGPGAILPAAWSSQLQIITSFLQLEPPSNIHMLDRAVGLVARTYEVSMNIPQKEIVLKFVDGQEAKIPMNSDCIRMLSHVVLDVGGCSEPEDQRDSMEGSACSGNTAGSTEDLPSPSSPSKSSKLKKHKRQRSLLFSLVSLLVPKSLSLSPSSSRPIAPPPIQPPPILAAGRVTSQPTILSSGPGPSLLRQRARATLIDVWRRHIVSALSPLHLPAAGYPEWTVVALISKVQSEIESIKTSRVGSRNFSLSDKRSRGSRHRRTQSEGSNAFDYGDREYDYASGRCRAPSPFSGMSDAEDADRVVYPRRNQLDEWGVRYVDRPKSFEEADTFPVEIHDQNDSLLEEHFTIGGDWDDDERPTLQFSQDLECYGVVNHAHLSKFGDTHPLSPEFDLGYSDDNGSRLAGMGFEGSRNPLVPSDVNDNEGSDDNQLPYPISEEDLPLAQAVCTLQGSTQLAAHSAPRPSLVSRAISSRPRRRNASAQFPNAISAPGQTSYPAFSTPPSLNMCDADSRDVHVDEAIYARLEYLDRICSALEVVRTRAHEEGWRHVRTTMIGVPNGWMDTQTERTLESKAKRRAWSSGFKIHAPYSSTPRFAPNAWDDRSSTIRSPMSPPGLTHPSSGCLQSRRPIVPTGLSLGIPLRSSPLAMYTWGTDNAQLSVPTKLNSMHSMKTAEGKRSSRVTFADSVTRLFPVCEDENEAPFEPARVNAVGFPPAEPLTISANKTEIAEAPADNEDDPFYLYPSRPRMRTKSIRIVAPTPSSPSLPILPMFRPSTPPSYQASVCENVSPAADGEEGGLDTATLLLQPLASLSTSGSLRSPPSRPSRTPHLPFVSRPRAASLPATKPTPTTNKTPSTTSDHEGCYKDLTRTYASPPPEGPWVISAIPAPREQYPRYAHIQSPISNSRGGKNTPILERKGKEVVFEQAGSEFTVGLEVALGRAEEGRAIW